MTNQNPISVVVAGNTTVHLGRQIGTYKDSGNRRYAKACSSSGRDRHEPFPVDAPITCKRCLAMLAKETPSDEEHTARFGGPNAPAEEVEAWLAARPHLAEVRNAGYPSDAEDLTGPQLDAHRALTGAPHPSDDRDSTSVRPGSKLGQSNTKTAPKGAKESNTMANKTKSKRVVARKGSTAKAKPAAKPAAKATGSRRSSEDLAKLAGPIAKMRKDGKKWDEIQEAHGVNAIVARKILAGAGYNNKGESEEIAKITGSGKSLATKVAKQRRNGVAFYQLALATGKSETELKSLLEEHGFAKEASGRTYAKAEAGGR